MNQDEEGIARLESLREKLQASVQRQEAVSREIAELEEQLRQLHPKVQEYVRARLRMAELEETIDEAARAAHDPTQPPN